MVILILIPLINIIDNLFKLFRESFQKSLLGDNKEACTEHNKELFESCFVTLNYDCKIHTGTSKGKLMNRLDNLGNPGHFTRSGKFCCMSMASRTEALVTYLRESISY